MKKQTQINSTIPNKVIQDEQIAPYIIQPKSIFIVIGLCSILILSYYLS